MFGEDLKDVDCNKEVGVFDVPIRIALYLTAHNNRIKVIYLTGHLDDRPMTNKSLKKSSEHSSYSIYSLV